MNIRSKLMLSFMLVTFLPTLLLAIFTTSLISQSRKSDAQEAINIHLKAAWMQYNARPQQMHYGMLQAATEPQIRSAVAKRDAAFLRNQLKAWKEYRPNVDIWLVTDEHAGVITSLHTGGKGLNLTPSLSDLVEKAVKSGKSIISTEFIPRGFLVEEGIASTSEIALTDESSARKDPVRDALASVVTTPVYGPAGSVAGVIITADIINNDSFVPDSFADIFPGALVTITLKDIQITSNVVGENGERIIGHSLPGPVYDNIRKNTAFRGDAEIAGEKYIAALDPILDINGRVIGSLFVGVRKDKFAALQYDNIKAISTIAFLAFFLATGFASFITYMVTRPITALKKKAQLVSSGSFSSVKADELEEGDDEIADLARTFNGMVASLVDKQERIRQNQDSLSQQKMLVESIINSLPYCLYVIERNMTIVAWNRHVSQPCMICKAFPGADCYNKDFMEHLADNELRYSLEGVIKSVFETGYPRSLDQLLTAGEPDRKEIYLSMSVLPIFSGDGHTVQYVVWMAEDITRKKLMEASVLSSEKLSAIGTLAAGVAHEVNNPLGGILNCLYNLRNTKLPEERKLEYIKFMEDGIKRAQNIVRQLLDFSQQHTPELQLVDVNQTIEGLIPLFGHYIKGREIRLVRRLGHGLAPLLADKHQIEQILVNLILNAIQAVDGGGVIEVSTMHEGEWFCIMVSDNGCGIPDGNLSKIFDPFFTTKGVGEGTGLGLSVSRGIIESHKGKIEVRSRPGKGSVFKVYLPVISERI